MAKISGKVLIAQGGGPTAVINQSLVGAVLESRKFPEVSKVYGAIHGVRGIINEDLLDLTQETTNNLECVAETPGSALLSTRDKPDEKYCKEIFKVCKMHDVRYFFYIGGNDSADTVKIVNQNAKLADYEMRCIHIPKTIDNDLMVTDHTPGFGSAARFVAMSFTGLNLDNRALKGVYIAIIMGRHAGFLTASSILGKKYPDDGPHLIYLPEKSFSTDQFLIDVKKVMDEHGRCIVAVSEGVHNGTGKPMMESLASGTEKDAHGNVHLSGGALGDYLRDLIKETFGYKRVRADTFGYLQRSFFGAISDVDQLEAREVGEKAAQYAIWDNKDGSVTIHRTGEYSVDYKLTALSEVAGHTKVMPDEFINEKGNNVTEAFFRYARPLIGSGFKSAYRIRAPRVPKIVNE